MDKEPCLARFALKVNICCKSCLKKLKNWMLTITGVYSVHLDDKKFVYVKGKIEPEKLIKKIKSKYNIKASLCSEHSKDDPEIHVISSSISDSDDDDDESSHHFCSNKPHTSCGGHKAEPYIELPKDVVSPEICDDKFCLWHQKNSNVIGNGQPFMQSQYFRRGLMPPMPSPYSMGMPPSYSMGMPPPLPPYIGMPPPMPPHQPFGYGYQRRDLATEFDHVSDFFSGENTRGCPTM